MLKRKHFPTPLIKEGEKPLLPIIQISKPARLRNLRLLFSFWGLIFRITWLTITRRATEAKKGKMVREMLESFGGLWIKAGQLVSMRSDLLEREFRDELSKLQDRAPGFPFESAKPMIEAAIGNEMDQVFSIFNETPIAAASLAQVYKAKLKTEEKWVAVKVQKPFANEYLKQDMKFINTLHFITKSLGLQAHSPMDEMVWELQQMMMEELDFRYEASHMRRMKKSLKPHKKIYVPKVYKTYCDRQVIVMEFIHGPTLSEYIYVKNDHPEKINAWLKENRIKPKKVARTLISSQLRQIFEDNLYHGDLHPGNLMLLKKNKIALIDFGNIGSSDVEFLKAYQIYMEAFTSKSFNKATDYMFLLSTDVIPAFHLGELKRELRQLMRVTDIKSSVKELPYNDKSLTVESDKINQVVAKHKVPVDYSIFKLGRAIGSLDMVLGNLDPEMNFASSIRRYSKEAMKRNRWKMISSIFALPGKISEISTIMAPIVRREAVLMKGALSKIEQFISKTIRITSIVLLGVFFFMVWGFLHQHYFHVVSFFHEGGGLLPDFVSSFPKIRFGEWIIILIFVLWVIRSLRKFHKSFSRPEPHSLRK